MMILNSDNFLLYAAKCYDNPGCFSTQEFKSDLDRIKFVKRLFRRYKRKNNIEAIRIRLVLNHIIILYNVFGNSATNILFFKLEKDLWYILKPFLILLNRLPKKIIEGFETEIDTTDIKMDSKIVDALRQI